MRMTRRPVGVPDSLAPVGGSPAAQQRSARAPLQAGVSVEAGELERRRVKLGWDGPRRVCESFDEAFEWAMSQSRSGDNIVLSPGCASYDWFPSFRERGEEFVRLARTAA